MVELNFPRPKDVLSLSLSLSLIARETMRLLVNHQFIPMAIQPKNISFEQICYTRFQCITTTSLHCLLFWTSKNKDLKPISKSATNVVLQLKFLGTSNVCFTLVAIKITNLIALRSTNQMTEISAPWWLSYWWIIHYFMITEIPLPKGYICCKKNVDVFQCQDTYLYPMSDMWKILSLFY